MMKRFTQLTLSALVALVLCTSFANAWPPMKDIELNPEKKGVTDGNYVYASYYSYSQEVGIRFHFDTDGATTFRVVDMLGNQIQDALTNATKASGLYEVTVDTNTLPNGVYLAEVTNNGMTVVTKFVVRH